MIISHFFRILYAQPISPQVYLDLLLRSRGYSTKRYETLKTAYYSSPTPLQQASYDLYLVGLVKKNDLVALSDAISCGLSPNPCNKYGESLAHMVCRRGNTPMLQLLLQNGASLQIGDDYGRTPLHDACWAAEPSFETVQVVLQADARLLHMIDARGHVPLNYVREHHWSQWIEFIDEQKDVFWPPLETTQGPPPLALQPPNTFSLPDPSRAMPLELAKMVASGKMTPEDVRIMYPEKFDDDIATVITSSAHDWDDDSDSDYDSEEEEDDSMDDDDLNALLSELPIR